MQKQKIKEVMKRNNDKIGKNVEQDFYKKRSLKSNIRKYFRDNLFNYYE